MGWVMIVVYWENLFHGIITAEKAMHEYEGFKDKITDGRNPSNSYIPRFRNVRKQEMDFLRVMPLVLAAEEEHRIE